MQQELQNLPNFFKVKCESSSNPIKFQNLSDIKCFKFSNSCTNKNTKSASQNLNAFSDLYSENF